MKLTLRALDLPTFNTVAAQKAFKGFIVAGGLYLLFAVVTALPVAVVVLAVAHMGGSTLWVFSTTLLQMLVPDGLRGRVFAAELALMTLGLTISNFVTGWALDTLGIGPRPLAALLGALCFLPGSAWLLLQTSARFRVVTRVSTSAET